MTEDEARTKWCPWARVMPSNAIVATNRHTDGTAKPSCRCIASDCMAWMHSLEKDGKRTGDCGLKWQP